MIGSLSHCLDDIGAYHTDSGHPLPVSIMIEKLDVTPSTGNGMIHREWARK